MKISQIREFLLSTTTLSPLRIPPRVMSTSARAKRTTLSITTATFEQFFAFELESLPNASNHPDTQVGDTNAVKYCRLIKRATTIDNYEYVMAKYGVARPVSC